MLKVVVFQWKFVTVRWPMSQWIARMMIATMTLKKICHVRSLPPSKNALAMHKIKVMLTKRTFSYLPRQKRKFVSYKRCLNVMGQSIQKCCHYLHGRLMKSSSASSNRQVVVGVSLSRPTLPKLRWPYRAFVMWLIWVLRGFLVIRIAHAYSVYPLRRSRKRLPISVKVVVVVLHQGFAFVCIVKRTLPVVQNLPNLRFYGPILHPLFYRWPICA